jgi:hypothetical protein
LNATAGFFRRHFRRITGGNFFEIFRADRSVLPGHLDSIQI